MSSNEMANHIEAAAWLRWGPFDTEDPIVPPPLYFRGMNGFIDRIGVADVTDPLGAALIYLQLDRYYTRDDVSIVVQPMNTTDLVVMPPAAAVPFPYPQPPMYAPFIQPMDSRLVYGEVPAPSTAEEVVGYFQTFNGFFLTLYGPGGEGLESFAGDLSIHVVRMPRGRTGPDTVEYKAFNFTP